MEGLPYGPGSLLIRERELPQKHAALREAPVRLPVFQEFHFQTEPVGCMKIGKIQIFRIIVQMQDGGDPGGIIAGKSRPPLLADKAGAGKTKHSGFEMHDN